MGHSPVFSFCVRFHLFKPDFLPHSQSRQHPGSCKPRVLPACGASQGFSPLQRTTWLAGEEKHSVLTFLLSCPMPHTPGTGAGRHITHPAGLEFSSFCSEGLEQIWCTHPALSGCRAEQWKAVKSHFSL